MRPFIGNLVQFLNPEKGLLISLVVQVDAVWSDMATKEFHAVPIWLIIEFALVEAYPLRREFLTKTRDEIEGILVKELRHYYGDIVDKAHYG